jgi:hypothetical protein
VVDVTGAVSPLPWRVDFSDRGGYDCMTGAWVIRAANGLIVAVIDQGSHGQRVGDIDFRSPEAEAIARHIVLVANSYPEIMDLMSEFREPHTGCREDFTGFAGQMDPHDTRCVACIRADAMLKAREASHG